MSSQEDLVSLFSRNLSLQNPIHTASTEEPVREQPRYFITQHYHHSNHVAVQQPTRPASEPPQTEQVTPEHLLIQNGIDASRLFASQINLFKTAEPAQQLRLLELWRIYPPDFATQSLAQSIGHCPETSFEQEETMARVRYERKMLEERMARTGILGPLESGGSNLSADTNDPLTPIQAGDGRWNSSAPEPYMASGYEALAAREYEESMHRSKDLYSHCGVVAGGRMYVQATDPVYNPPGSGAVFSTPGSGAIWGSLDGQSRAMEDQYGAFQQRYYGGRDDFDMM